MPCKGKFSWEEGFLGKAYNSEIPGLGKLLGKCLKQIRVMTRAEFQKVNVGVTVPGRMTVVLYTTVKLPGSLMVV